MALKVEDRVKETTTTTGTGDITVGGAVTGHQTFANAGVAVGDTFHYLIEEVDSNGLASGAWETGIGTRTGTSTIARTECKSSSAGGVTKVTFGAGTKHISLSFTATHAKTFTSTPTSPSVLTPYGRSESYGALTFQDEFDAASLNTSVWNNRIWYADSAESNATINYDLNNSKLRIWPQRTNGTFYNRTIDTDGKFYQLYGYFEASMKLCNGYGTWPAFWLFNHEDGGNRPEIDIMEAYCGGENAGNGGWSNSSDQPTNAHFTVWTYCGVPCGTVGDIKLNDAGLGVGRLDNAFHRYAVKWESSGLTFFFDGQQVGSKFNTNQHQRRMYIMLDLWYGSASGNPHSPPSGVPMATQNSSNSFEIEYVRAWALS